MTPIDYALAVRERLSDPRNPSGWNHMLRAGGARTLSDLELLSFILAPSPGRPALGAARKVLEEVGWSALFPEDSEPSLWGILAPSQAARLTAAVELARRLGGDRHGLRPVLRTPREVYEATADLRTQRREHFLGLYLNTRNRLLARETISVGSLNASIVHPREVFEPALRLGAASVVVVHNHPSGETDPSEDDLCITRRLAEAGEILGITLLDHVIVAVPGYTSLKEEGRL